MKKPAATIKDRMIYLCFVQGRNGAVYIAERDAADLDRPTTIKDITEGQIEGLVQVLECNPAETICSDVTAEIAGEVMLRWAYSGEPLTDKQRDFVELHVSVQAANSFARAA